ncbi:MAG: hypothetical protein BWX80_02761 [Candidatus Hydrogenedentes bacterium ADurb.Bin101]|nr:MAG: hypothetical protein BWX80_02761 [Candidatus Hydrogenedentes bacterium ADurb.Bin101]
MLVRYPFYTIIGGAALAAKDEGIQGLVGLARLGAEFVHFQVADAFFFDGGPDCVAPGKELVQAEGEYGKAA